ncbi:hypothetical protein E2C01_100894 [Portunus trituberculatus]|uniref:Uncharacterized protein n=1 Tax=Portunus trituberculatus TaxID=210409 RepID=A0A5B7K977_PORTR|nr:hypothetical protein [Portunus trituberculatus]
MARIVLRSHSTGREQMGIRLVLSGRILILNSTITTTTTTTTIIIINKFNTKIFFNHSSSNNTLSTFTTINSITNILPSLQRMMTM